MEGRNGARIALTRRRTTTTRTVQKHQRRVLSWRLARLSPFTSVKHDDSPRAGSILEPLPERETGNGEQGTVDNVRVFVREEQRVVIGTRPLSAWRAHDRSTEYARYRHDSVSPSCRDESNPHSRDIDGKHPGMQSGIPLVTREKRQCFEFSYRARTCTNAIKSIRVTRRKRNVPLILMISFLSRCPAYGSCERPLFVTLAIVTRARNTVPDFLTKTIPIRTDYAYFLCVVEYRPK